MKILKYIFLLLLLIGIAGFVFIATQPGEYSFTKKKEIAVSKDVVFNFINDFENWHLWNVDVSPSSEELFAENSKTYTITNGNSSIVYETLEEFSTDSIVQKITQNELNHTLTWKFTPTKKGTLITCNMQGTMTLKEKVLSVLQGGAQNYLGTNLEENLTSIEKYLTTQLNKYNIKINGLVTKEGTLLIKQIDSSSLKKYNSIARSKFSNLISFAKENSINFNESPFILFEYWDTVKNTTKYSVCLPVKEEIITSEGSDVLGGEIFEFRAVKVTLTGDYSHLRKAWDEAFKYIQKNKLTEDINGNYIETYKVFPPNEKEPSKWVTEIYVPIKSEVIPKRKPTTNTSVEPVLETKETTE